MKKYYVLLMALMLVCPITHAAVLRVNNQFATNASEAIFNTLQEAHDAAEAGDTLMIEGSATAYASVTFSKKLVVIGTGYFLTENEQSQASALSSIVNYINLKSGSEGTILIGLEFQVGAGFDLPAPVIEVNDIIVMRCYIPNPISFLGTLQNIKILQNYIRSTALVSNNLGVIPAAFSDVELSNNIIYSINVSSSSQGPRVFSKVEHNIFVSSVNITASVIRSNIFLTDDAWTTLNSSIIQNNLFKQTAFEGSGNITYSSDDLFVSEPPVLNLVLDREYQLKNDSPYKTSGYNGSEPGVFGESFPYVLSGIPPVPTIFDFSADSFGSKESGLTIQLKAKSNF